MMLNYIHKISSVRVYLPKDLRSSDSKFTVGKSIKVHTRGSGAGWNIMRPVSGSREAVSTRLTFTGPCG